ncbi:hypothetical protein HMPREF1619_04379 [Klebsiella pneumoniae 909957]|nr:hypothetical protein HMPREF1619_04379 [Klebsiella pneumoniae 909957]
MAILTNSRCSSCLAILILENHLSPFFRRLAAAIIVVTFIIREKKSDLSVTGV